MQPKRKLRLSYSRGLAPGDYVVTTALLRDIQTQYPGRFEVGFNSTMPAVYANNPNHTTFSPDDPDVEDVTLGYMEGIKSSMAGNKTHFVAWLYRDFFAKTRIWVDCAIPRPDLHLSAREKAEPPISGRYWVVFGGGKSDFTVKHWDFGRYQQVVDELRPHGVRFVQSGSTAKGHSHPRLKNVLDLVGWGYLREMFWKIYHAEGVISPITLGMHVAAAFEKPCVVIAGGREEPWFEAYDNNYGQFGDKADPVRVPHRYLHTIGRLDCCQTRGCWTNKVIATDKDSNACTKLATRTAGLQPLPECMNMIAVPSVASAVLGYYHNQTLEPIVAPMEPRLLVSDVPWQPLANVAASAPVSVLNGPEVNARRRGIRLDTAIIGGKFTICTILEGAHWKLHQQLLDSIMRTTPRVRMDLRIGLSNVVDRTRKLVSELPVRKLYESDDMGHYRLMRRMFHDPECPLETNYVVWFDDDVEIRHADWLNLAADNIERQARLAASVNVGMYAPPLAYDTENDGKSAITEWCETKSWYRSRSFRAANKTDSPAGNFIHFGQTWFCILSREAIDRCDLPDVDCDSTGGDIVIGEQLHQQGLRVVPCNMGMSLAYRIDPTRTSRQRPSSNYPWQ